MLDFLGFFINLSNQTKMFIRLFMPPALLFISGLIIPERQKERAIK